MSSSDLYFFTCGYPAFLVSFTKDFPFFSACSLMPSLSKNSLLYTDGFISGFSVLLVFRSCFYNQHQAVLITIDLQCILKSYIVMLPALFRTALVI